MHLVVILTTVLVTICVNRSSVGAEEDFCEKGVEKLTVRAAFKVNQWLAIFGEVLLKGQTKSTAQVFRVHYNERGDPSESKSTDFWYFGATYWTKLRELSVTANTDTFHISYAFSTENIVIFIPKQTNNNLAYITSKGITTVYDIDTHRPVGDNDQLQEPNFRIAQQQTAYDSILDEDHSRKLTLKVLLLHFPSTVTILDIMIFNRKLFRSNQILYYALVYTEEEKDGKYYYMRHLMKSDEKYYEDYEYRRFERLYWHFDNSNDYCEAMTEKISAVAYLRHEESYTFVDWTEYTFLIYFIEFYGDKHRIVRLEFIGKIDKYFFVTEVDNIDNKEMLNCKQHPDFQPIPPIKCEDYPYEKLDDIGSYDTPDLPDPSGSSQGIGGTTIWQWLGLIVMLIAIIAVIAFIIYLSISPKNTKPN